MAALDALARRDHSSEELRRKLLDKGYEAGVVAAVLERLLAEHLLDDPRYIDQFVAYHAARGHGPLRVRAQLRQVGLTGELVEAGIAAYADWPAQIQAARKKKFGSALPTQYPDKQRQAKFLAYRGFTSAQIRHALGFDTDLSDDNEEL